MVREYKGAGKNLVPHSAEALCLGKFVSEAGKAYF